MLKLSIKRQLWLALALTLVALLAIWSLERFYQARALEAVSARAMLAGLEIEMLALRRAEKDFLARKNAAYVERFDDTFSLYQTDMAALHASMRNMGLQVQDLKAVDQHFLSYRDSFHQVVEQQQQIGFDHESGLYGALRQAAHDVEQVVGDHPALLASLLMLRRHEKDFMLRRMEKYAQRFMTTLSDFRGLLFLSDIDGSVLAPAQIALRQYNSAFQDLAQAERNIGLSHETGLHGEMREAIHQAERAFAVLRDQLDARLAEYVREVTQLASALVLIMGLIIAGILIWVIRDLSRSFSHATGRARALAQGDWQTPIRVRRRDEVGELLQSLDHMREEVNKRAARLEANGRVKSMLSELSQVLQGVKDTGQLADDVIRFLTPLLGCQVGTLYALEGNNLHFKAGYGIEERAMRQRAFELGEGLAGQAALNQEIMRISQVPEGYLNVASATGSSRPVELVLIPLLWNNQLFGIIELASITTLDDEALRFLSEAEEPVAVALNACQVRQEMSRVLEEAWDKTELLEQQKAETETARQALQQQAEQLQASEEELRVQQEELQAQQEELRVTNEELEAQARLLHERTRELERANQRLRDDLSQA